MPQESKLTEVRSKDDILALVVFYRSVADRADAAGLKCESGFLTDTSYALAWAAGMPAPDIDEKVRCVKRAAAAAAGTN
jgi:hypothetical protein